MKRSPISLFRFLCLAGLCLAFAACHDPTPARQGRPLPGDTVTPEIHAGKTWEQGETGYVAARLRVQGAAGAEPDFLFMEDVPYADVPRITLTYFEGDRELKRQEDVPLERDC